MITVSLKTKRGQELAQIAQHWDGDYLWQIYDSYSPEKERAYNACREMCYKEGGTGFSIISHNTFSFSVSWFCEDCIRIETYRNSYRIVD